MVYKHIQKIDRIAIQRFADIYGYPDSEYAISLFHQIHGGQPVGYYVHILKDDSIEPVFVQQLLTFDDGDYAIEDAMRSFYLDDDIIPLAICENDGYLCYAVKTSTFCFCDAECSDFYPVVWENGTPYTLDDFYDDLKP